MPRDKPATYTERMDDCFPYSASTAASPPFSSISRRSATSSTSTARVPMPKFSILPRLSSSSSREPRCGYGSVRIERSRRRRFLEPAGARWCGELEALSRRVENYLNASLARLESPYLQGRTSLAIVVGYGLALQNLARSERQFRAKCLLKELLIHEELGTVYQPIIDMAASKTMGFEALSRGPVVRFSEPSRSVRDRRGGEPRVRARSSLPPESSQKRQGVPSGDEAVRHRLRCTIPRSREKAYCASWKRRDSSRNSSCSS